MTRVVAVVGPTAVGKSAVALALAERLGGEIVNADALQVYRGFDLGTAKPTPDEQRRVRHHLVDILDPWQAYSAGEFARRARRIVEEIGGRGRVAFVVGGSGLYQRALLEGIARMPPGDPRLRGYLEDRLERDGPAAVRPLLELLDPVTAERVAVADRQRLLRALEVALSSGRRLSDWIARQPFGDRPLHALRIGLTLSRRLLYDRIAKRVRAMVDRGWVEEVRGLLHRGLSPDLPAFQAIGYRQLASHLRGECSLEEAVEEAIRATRRFAKRQETWYRRESGVSWLPAQNVEECVERALSLLEADEVGGDRDQD